MNKYYQNQPNATVSPFLLGGMDIPVMGLASAVVFAAVVIWACRVLNWVWLRPKRLEECLKQQGFAGTPYKLLVGDVRRRFKMVEEAKSRPIDLTDDILPRVLPLLSQTVEKYGKNSYTWMGPVPRVILMNPDHIKEVFNRIYDFPKPHVNPLIRSLATGLANYEGDKWAKHRRIINPAFHQEKLKNMVPVFFESCSEMIRKWDELVSEPGSSGELDVWPHLMSLTSDVISRTAFGSSYEEGKKIFQLQDEQVRLIIKAFQLIFVPGGRFLPTKTNNRIKQIDREVTSALKWIIEKKEKALKAGEAQTDDLLGILLESNSEQTGGHGMSIRDVIEECKLFYFAGQETTSVLLVWTLVMLSQHQDWQSRARDEALRVFGQDKPDFDRLNQLKVVTMILYEVLRLYPPVVLLSRAVEKQMKLGDLTLPAGAQINIPILLIQRDKDLWGQDAAEFKPERFADGVSKATKNKVSFLPFAWGPRICIGQNFALAEAKLALALILQSFRVELSPSYTHAPYQVITLHPQFGAHLVLHKL